MKVVSAVGSQDATRAGGGTHQSEQAAQRGGLARSVLTEQTEHPTRGHGEIEVVEGQALSITAPERFGDADHLDDRLHDGRTHDESGLTDCRCRTPHAVAAVGACVGQSLRGRADDEPPDQTQYGKEQDHGQASSRERLPSRPLNHQRSMSVCSGAPTTSTSSPQNCNWETTLQFGRDG